MSIFAAGEIQPRQPGGAQYVQNVRIYAGIRDSAGVVDYWNSSGQIVSFNHQSPYYITVDRTLQSGHTGSNGWWVEIDFYLGMPKPLNVSLPGIKLETIYPSFGRNTYKLFIPFKYGDSTLKFDGTGILMDIHFNV